MKPSKELPSPPLTSLLLTFTCSAPHRKKKEKSGKNYWLNYFLKIFIHTNRAVVFL